MPERRNPARRLAVWTTGLLLAGLAAGVAAGDAGAQEWRLSLPGWRYEFPRDHGSHPEFKTEWWYFTGNLRTAAGREFGYQLTFFRQGIIPPAERRPGGSRFITGDLSFAHFAISDLQREKFFFGQVLSRGAFGEAGFNDGARLAWIEDSSLTLRPDGSFHLVGRDAEKSLDLTLRSAKPPVFHGADGVSQKADGPGRASHYYSLTRLEATGTITLDGAEFAVTGLSWFDQEWATNQLAAHQVGWDWFSLQFTDGTELMLFQLRTKDGGRDKWSGGTWVAADGTTTRVGNDEFTLEPLEMWKSPGSGGEYPVRWRVRIPKHGVDLEVKARMKDQELRLDPISYWEGSIAATGTHTGTGYLEMTGYAGRIVGLQAE